MGIISRIFVVLVMVFCFVIGALSIIGMIVTENLVFFVSSSVSFGIVAILCMLDGISQFIEKQSIDTRNCIRSQTEKLLPKALNEGNTSIGKIENDNKERK